jgi:hypothetical protein
MPSPDSFIKSISSALNPTFKFPSISLPGLPNFALGCFEATFAGINYALQFIPPTPSSLPNIKPPSIGLFSSAFLSSVKMPSSYSSVSLGPLTLPGKGGKSTFDSSAMIKLVAVCIVLPFMLIEKFITGLLNLQIILPTLGGVSSLFTSLAKSLGLVGDSISKFGLALAKAIVALFTSLI